MTISKTYNHKKVMLQFEAHKELQRTVDETHKALRILAKSL